MVFWYQTPALTKLFGWIFRSLVEVPKILLSMTTVDGSEIRRSPVEVGSLSHYLQGFKNIPGGCLGFLPSTITTDMRIESKIHFSKVQEAVGHTTLKKTTFLSHHRWHRTTVTPPPPQIAHIQAVTIKPWRIPSLTNF